jgi:hypothetical protein
MWTGPIILQHTENEKLDREERKGEREREKEGKSWIKDTRSTTRCNHSTCVTRPFGKAFIHAQHERVHV